MDELFVEVRKISSKPKEAQDGTSVVHPTTKKTIKESIIEVHTESIRVDQIRSFRRWGKTADQEAQVEGDITKIYLQGDGARLKKPEMLIEESYTDFADRLKTIRANG